jgi:hypothetical protein
MEPAEVELLSGMGNCYSACGEDFEATVRMVANARHRAPDDVKTTLRGIRERYGTDPEYRRLRARFPDDFPV